MKCNLHDIETYRMIISFILNENLTIRECARKLYTSKSTIHNIIHKDIRINFYSYYVKIIKVLEDHYNNKHINGGKATHDKYAEIRRQKWIF